MGKNRCAVSVYDTLEDFVPDRLSDFLQESIPPYPRENVHMRSSDRESNEGGLAPDVGTADEVYKLPSTQIVGDEELVRRDNELGYVLSSLNLGCLFPTACPASQCFKLDTLGQTIAFGQAFPAHPG